MSKAELTENCVIGPPVDLAKTSFGAESMTARQSLPIRSGTTLSLPPALCSLKIVGVELTNAGSIGNILVTSWLPSASINGVEGNNESPRSIS